MEASLIAFAVIIAVVVVIAFILVLDLLFENKDKSETTPKLPSEMTKGEKDKYKEEKQKREWTEPNKKAEYLCNGGKVQCKYCNVPISEVIVTSNTVKIQDKNWATVKDNDGLVNFNFTGQCMHPSQQKPFSPPPPCKSIINLGEWKNYSDGIYVNEYSALATQATIPCMISGEDIEIIDSGQTVTLTKLELDNKHKRKVTDVYWIEDGGKEKQRVEYPNYPVTLYIETDGYKPNDMVEIKFISEEDKLFSGNKKELTVSGEINTDGIAIVKDFMITYHQ